MTIIAFEGMDGSGKSSLIASLENWIFTNKHREVFRIRQPGCTSLGEQVRDILKGPPIPERVLHLLIEAARVDVLLYIEQMLKLNPDAIFLLDRHKDTSYAYQKAGGVSESQIVSVQSTYDDLIQPDFTFLLDLAPAVAKSRLQTRGEVLDRFDDKDLNFFQEVRKNYLDIFFSKPLSHAEIIDASESPEEVLNQVIDRLESVCML